MKIPDIIYWAVFYRSSMPNSIDEYILHVGPTYPADWTMAELCKTWDDATNKSHHLMGQGYQTSISRVDIPRPTFPPEGETA